SALLKFSLRSSCPPSVYSTSPPASAIDPLSLHDALPIWACVLISEKLFSHGTANDAGMDGIDTNCVCPIVNGSVLRHHTDSTLGDRKSTRLNSSHVSISYAVFCLKKKKGR